MGRKKTKKPRRKQWTAAELHAIQMVDWERWQRIYQRDAAAIGTPHYQGIAMCHAWEYRHWLRTPYDVMRAKRRRTCPSHTEMMRLYRRLHTAWLRAGLVPGEASPEHEAIIRRIMQLEVR